MSASTNGAGRLEPEERRVNTAAEAGSATKHPEGAASGVDIDLETRKQEAAQAPRVRIWSERKARKASHDVSSAFTKHLSRAVSVSGVFWQELANRKDGQAQDPGSRSERHRSVLGLPVLSCWSWQARTWSVLMTVLDAVYTAALLPIETAFELSLDSNPGFVGWWVLGIGAGVLSVLDVLMGFHIGRIVTLQLDKREVRDGRLVALYYMRHSTFWVDLLAAVAFLAQMALWVADVDSVAAMQILSFFRYLRIGRLVQRLFKAMSSASWVWGPLSNPVVISTLSLLYLTAVYVNFLGCFWYWVARREGIGGDNWLTWYGLTSELDQHGNMAFQAPLREQYLASIYFVVTTVTTVGYGDIIPVNPGEQLAAMLVQLSGLVVFGVLISTVVELGQGVNRSLRRGLVFSNKMRSVQRWMLRRNLPKELRQEVQLYYSGVWLRLQELAEREVLGELPHKLRARVVYTAVGELLREVQLFQGMERGDLLELSARLQSLIVAPGSSLSVEGDEANCIWLLERGEVRVFRYDKLLQILDRPGMMFGEMALLRYASPAYRMRMVSFRATTTCRVWHLPMQSLYPLLRARRELYEKLLDRLAAHLQGRLVGLAEGEREVVMDALQLVQRMRRTDLAQLSTSRPEASLPRSTSEELAEAADADTDADVLAEPDADDAPFAPDGRQPSCTSLTIGASAWRGEEHGRARPSGAAGSSCSASPLEEGEEPATAAQPGCQNGVPERAWMGIELQPSAKSQLQRCGTSMSSSSVSVLRTASVPPDDLRSCVRFEPLQHQGATAPPPPHAACPAAAALPMQQPACQLARTCPRSSVASQPAARAAPLTQHRSRPCATMSGEERRPVSQRRGAHLEAALYSTHPTSHISTHDFPPAIPPSPHASSPSDLWTSLPNGSHALHNDPWLAELDSEGATNPFAANLSPRQLGRSPFDTASLNAGLP